jgi:hypothetical protein
MKTHLVAIALVCAVASPALSKDVSSTGDLVVGLAWPLAFIDEDGKGSTLSAPSSNQTLWLACTAGPGGKIGVLDSCPNAFVLNDNVASHVIPCKDVAPSLP